MPDLLANFQRVQERIAAAAARAGRSADDVGLVVVTKYVGLDQITPLVGKGMRAIGENRVQEALEKYEKAPWRNQVEWHMIGHLQRNKVRHCLQFADLIHSVDSERLLREINRRAAELQRDVVRVLIQVNVSGEESKFGISPDEVGQLLAVAEMCERVQVEGLMTMAPYVEDPETVRPYFRCLRLLAEEMGQQGFTRSRMKYLSMGMSNDFEVAVEEGANLVRIGSAIFRE